MMSLSKSRTVPNKPREQAVDPTLLRAYTGKHLAERRENDNIRTMFIFLWQGLG